MNLLNICEILVATVFLTLTLVLKAILLVLAYENYEEAAGELKTLDMVVFCLNLSVIIILGLALKFKAAAFGLFMIIFGAIVKIESHITFQYIISDKYFKVLTVDYVYTAGILLGMICFCCWTVYTKCATNVGENAPY